MTYQTGQLALIITAFIVLTACGPSPNPIRELWSATDTSSESATTPQEYPIAVDSAQNGLAELKSYQANLSLDFEGIRSGEPAAGHVEAVTKVTQQPPAVYQYLDIDLDIDNPRISAGTSELFNIDDKIYIKKGTEEPWLAFANTQIIPDTLGFFEFDRLIVIPEATSTSSQIETLNGINVEHYTFDESNLSHPNIIFEEAKGDLWLAPPDNYVMQYVISATIRYIIPDPKVHVFDQGQFNLRYTLNGVNTTFTIRPPAEAMAANDPINTLPRLPDAEIISVFPTLIEYTSVISTISATLFYRDELSGLGWTEENSAIFNEKSL
ncbi:MAG: hypothetical protein R3264_22795, partial [Anaerolineae bacterium]|nr:hypothetical protein [Anaerolineae bacterium]